MNVVKSHEEIIGYLNQYGISESDYSVGEYSERRICVIDDFGGYLIFDGKEDAWLNQKLVLTPWEVADEIRKRIVSSKSPRLSHRFRNRTY